ITLKNVPPPVWLLVTAGCLEIVRTSAWRTIRFRALASFGVLFLVAILFSAHGEENRYEEQHSKTGERPEADGSPCGSTDDLEATRGHKQPYRRRNVLERD